MNIEIVLKLVEKLVGFGILVQSCELLVLSKHWKEGGLWSWSIVRRDFDFFPPIIKKILDFMMKDHSLLVWLILRVLLVGFLYFFKATHSEHLLIFGFLLISHVVLCLRWRGSVNGGSDFMTLVVLSSLVIGHLDFENSQTAVLYFIAVQAITSYFVAGIIKLRSMQWRRGIALSAFARQSLVEGLFRKSFADGGKVYMLLLTWIVILFEVLFPLAFVGIQFAGALVAIAFVFHLGNAFVFGLNRFVWAWLASYPAILFAVAKLT